MIDDLKRKIESRIDRLTALLEENTDLSDAVDAMETVLRKGNKILVFGNGGSAAQASHLAAELVNKFYFERPGLPAVALTTDMANITSIANDSDYRYIFSRQVEALGREGDAAVGISTSGTSANVLEGFEAAKKKNMKTIALCGNRTGALLESGVDVIVGVKSEDTPVIQEIHLFMLHMMAETLEKNFFGDKFGDKTGKKW